MIRKKTVFYSYPALSSFVRKDLKIFEEKYFVVKNDFLPKNKLLTPIYLLKQLFNIFRWVFKIDIFICQFSGYHSFLPALVAKLFHKPCLIIPGGTDCVSFPSIQYGNFNKKLLGKFTGWTYYLAAHIAPVHESLIKYNSTYLSKDHSSQGILHFCKGLKTPITVIFNGYNASSWFCNDAAKRSKNSFLTVAAGLEMRFTRRLKGIDLILEVANQFPECSFTIVGGYDGLQIDDLPGNIKILWKMPNEELKEVYCSNTFYLQLSISEGFPNALCEAMLAGCVPIVSNVSSMPAIVGDSGYVLYKRNIIELKQLIAKALNDDIEAKSKAARDIIARNYSEEQRKNQLHKLVDHLIDKN